MGFVINDNTNANINNRSAHLLCRWSYLRKITTTTETHLSRKTYAMDIIIIIIGIQPLGRFGHRPELSQATGMALVRCSLGKFLGVVCHCFPPCLDVPTFATRCLHVHHDVRDPSGRRWNCGQESCPVILLK